MTIPTWPSSFPKPSLKELSWETRDNRVVSEMDDGEPLIRIEYDNPLTEYKAVFRARNSDVAVMLAYIRTTLQSGSKWLYMPIRTEFGIIDHEVLFIEQPRNRRALSVGWVLCECRLLIRGQDLLLAGLLDYLLANDISASEFTVAIPLLHDCITNNKLEV